MRWRAILVLLLTSVALGPTVRAAESVELSEVLEILKSNLAGTSPADLNRAAVAGLLDQLATRVTLVDDTFTNKTESTRRSPAVTSTTFDRYFAYVRLGQLSGDAGREFQSAWDGLSSSNKLRGLILDLRFTTGGDNAAAVAVADRFFESARDLVDWGEGLRKSTTKSNALALPTAVLINRQTAGAAELLAGILRHGEIALLVGTNTAGLAGTTKEFTLKTGQKLRVAIAPVKVLDGRELPFAGIKPDIMVTVDRDEEHLFMADAYRVIKGSAAPAGIGDSGLASTNRPRRRMNEADLVRMSREGQDPRDATTPPGSGRISDPAEPLVTDPALIRALDLLKGLSVVQRFRGP